MVQEIGEGINGFLGLDADSLKILQMSLRAVVVYITGLAMIRVGEKRFLAKSSAFDVLLSIIVGSVLNREINGSAAFLPTLGASIVLVGLSSANLIAVRIFLSECFSFLPPFLPLAQAAANPAKILSQIIWRSNSAIAPKMLKTNLPSLVVSIASVRLTKPIPLALKSSISIKRCLRVLPSRSSRHTTKVSPLRSWSIL